VTTPYAQKLGLTARFDAILADEVKLSIAADPDAETGRERADLSRSRRQVIDGIAIEVT
jgi:hypothetical protein